MNDFKQILYEALLVAFGKTLAKYNAFAQATILRDVGRELIDYLNRHGFAFEESGTPDDLARLTNLFVQNGFAEKLEVEPASIGHNYIWHHLYGRNAYKELHDVSDNPFLACPLNLCLYYIADKHHKTMRLHSKSFEADSDVVESQYEVIDKEPLKEGESDPLVIENARLYEIARERAAELQTRTQQLEKEIEERKRAELAVQHMQEELMQASRRAGQAEVAAGVLHHVGNALTSVNVSVAILRDRLRDLRLANLERTARLLQEHQSELAQFLSTDERGHRVPEFLTEISHYLQREQSELLEELAALDREVANVKAVVAAQQIYADPARVSASGTSS